MFVPMMTREDRIAAVPVAAKVARGFGASSEEVANSRAPTAEHGWMPHYSDLGMGEPQAFISTIKGEQPIGAFAFSKAFGKVKAALYIARGVDATGAHADVPLPHGSFCLREAPTVH